MNKITSESFLKIPLVNDLIMASNSPEMRINELWYIAHEGLLETLEKFMHTKQRKIEAAVQNDQFSLFFWTALEMGSSFKAINILPYELGGKEQLENLVKNNPKYSIHEKTPPYPKFNWTLPFTELKQSIMTFLNTLSENQRLTIKDYEIFFELLQKGHSENLLKEEVEALMQLIVYRTTILKPGCNIIRSKAPLTEFMNYVLQFRTRFGADGFLLFCKKASSLEGRSIRSFSEFLSSCINCEYEMKVIAGLELFAEGSITFKELKLQISPNINQPSTRKIYIEKDDLKLRQKRFVTDKSIKYPLSSAKLDALFYRYSKVLSFCEDFSTLDYYQLVTKGNELKQKAKRTLTEFEQLQLIAIGVASISHEFGFNLQSTQVLAVIALAFSETNCFGQALTGERKTFILGLLIFTQAMQGHAVDFVTSNRSLSKRDCKLFSGMYGKFGISSSSISVDNQEPEHFRAQVLYGTATDFEFAIMRDMLFSTKLFAERSKYVSQNFDCIIVDEADNIVIDTSVNGARLGYESEYSYHWIYAPIFKFLRNHPFGTISQLRKFLSSNVHESHFLTLSKLTDQQLETWKESAAVALHHHKERVDYVVDSQKNDKGELILSIQIVDHDNTGQLQESSRWSSGVHEFVEVKHDIEVKKESCCPISLSHANFYSMYRRIYGLSGTLGTREDRREMEELYQIKTFDIPPHLPSKRTDLPARIYNTDREYFQAIITSIRKALKEGQPTLVICPSIRDTEELMNILKREDIKAQVYNEVQDDSEEVILKNAGKRGVVTVATNTASRGTDIRLEEAAKKIGLKVIVSYPAKNLRILLQMLGRAGRGGDPGTTEIILSLQRGILKQFYGLGLPEQVVLKQLVIKLKEAEDKVQLTRLQICENERINYIFVERFYKQFNDWLTSVDNTNFLESNAVRLGNLRLTEAPIVVANLTPFEKNLAMECYKLLCTNDYSEVAPLLWKAVLKQAIKKIKETILFNWSTHFYHEIQKRSTHSPFTAKVHRELCDTLYEKHCHTWETHLKASENSIFDYLYQITNLNLKDIDMNSVSVKDPIREIKSNPKLRIDATLKPSAKHLTKEEMIFVGHEHRAKQNDEEAMFKVALCYSLGEGVARDLLKAKEWYTKSAGKYKIEAIFNLGLLLDIRAGLKEDHSKAFDCYLLAARKDLPIAHYMVGNCHLHGIGTTKNLTEAFKSFNRAAALRNIYGIHALGQCYEEGWGVLPNYFKAVDLYELAAENHFPPAKRALANCLKKGRGCVISEKLATSWIKEAEAYELAQKSKHHDEPLKFLELHQCTTDSNRHQASPFQFERQRLDPKSEYDLGVMHFKNKNLGTAGKHFYHAAYHGLDAAAYMVAWLIRYGQGSIFEESLTEILRLEKQAGTKGAIAAEKIMQSTSFQCKIWSRTRYNITVDKVRQKTDNSPNVWIDKLEKALENPELNKEYGPDIHFALTQFDNLDDIKNRPDALQKTLSHLEAAAKGGHAEAQMQYGLFRTNNIYSRKALNTITFKKKEVVGYLQESIKILDRKNLTEAQIAIVKERLELIEKEDSCVVM